MIRLFAFVSVCFASYALAADRTAVPVDPPTFADAEYVSIDRDGHLQQRGQRVRFWGFIGHAINVGNDIPFPKATRDSTPAELRARVPQARADLAAYAQRISDLGFNLVRWWDAPDLRPYEIGDGTDADLSAFFMKELADRGISIWYASTNSMGKATAEDAGIIDEAATAETWVKSVGAGLSYGAHGSLATFWDPRLQALRKKRLAAVVDFRNLYKGGLRLADDPQVVVWELTNEEWWLARMCNSKIADLPPFFRDQLLNRWHAFLTSKYGDDATLAKAWKFLLPGESLGDRTVQLLPLATRTGTVTLNDANTEAVARLSAVDQAYTRDDFTRARGEDVLEFLVQLYVQHKTSERDIFKTLGKSCRLSPLVLDTGDGYRIHSLYMLQQGDAIAMCTYLWGVAKDPAAKRFPWIALADEAPRAAEGIPWAEIGRVPGKPFFIYETQMSNPAKYRADFPYRMAALGAVQDWDIVNWHIFGRLDSASKPRPYSNAMHMSTKDNGVEGLHYRNDEVMCSALKAAGTLFRAGALKTVENPTTVVFGRRSLYDPAGMDYGKSYGTIGPRLMATTYRYGTRMSVDPSQEKDKVVGKLVDPRTYETSPVRPTDEIEYDWQKGHLKLDAPAAVSYSGFFAQHGGPVTFANGLTLENVSIANPPGMAYPVTPAEQYIAFAAASTDGRPLSEASRVFISLVSTSFNSEYALDEKEVARGENPLIGQRAGKAPVLVARAGATLRGPAMVGMRYVMRNWQMEEVQRGEVVGGRLTIPSDLPVFFIELNRDSRP